MHKRVPNLLFCIIFALIFMFSVPNFAISGGSIEVRQTKIVFNAENDQGKSIQFGIANNSDEEMFVKIEKADFTIADDGAFLVKEPGSNPNSANSYISCNELEFIMKPGQNNIFDVILNTDMEYILPEYLSTILVKYISKSEMEIKSNIKTYAQVAIAVRVLSGNLIKNNIDISTPPIDTMNISGNRLIGYGGKKTIKSSLKNTGLMTIEPTINATVNSVFSGVVEEISDIKGYIMPGQTREYNIDIEALSIFDIRTISFSYEYKYADVDFKGESSFTYLILSYQLLIGITLVIAGVIWQARYFKKKIKLLKDLTVQNNALIQNSAAIEDENQISVTAHIEMLHQNKHDNNAIDI